MSVERHGGNAQFGPQSPHRKSAIALLVDHAECGIDYKLAAQRLFLLLRFWHGTGFRATRRSFDIVSKSIREALLPHAEPHEIQASPPRMGTAQEGRRAIDARRPWKKTHRAEEEDCSKAARLGTYAAASCDGA